MLFLIEGTLGELWRCCPTGGLAVPLVAICALAQLLGIWMRRGGMDFAPLWVLKAIVTLGTLLAAAGCVFSGSTTTGFTFFFLWVTPYAVYFGLRQAAVQTALAVLCVVGPRLAIADGQFVTSELGSWLLPAATIIVVSSIVHQLTRGLGRSDRERIVSESERAEAEARRAASERERAHREAAMARLAVWRCAHRTARLLLDETVRVLTETLRVEHCAIRVAARRHAHGCRGRDRLRGRRRGPARAALAGHVLAGDEPIIVWEWASERRFSPSPACASAAFAPPPPRPSAGARRLRRHRRALPATVGAFSGEEGQCCSRSPTCWLGPGPRALGGGHAPPVAARRAHRPAQPRAALRPRRARLRPRRALRLRRRRAPARRRRLQDGQRPRSATRPATSC
jgi:hypothetical protein